MPETGQAETRTRKSIRPLGRLLPYLSRYRGMVTGALISLALAAIMSLALPLAVRRMIDHGAKHVAVAVSRHPEAATPIAPPTWRAVLSTADAVPACWRSTLDRIDVVMAGTARPMPDGISRNGTNSPINGVVAPTRCSRP